MRAVTLAIILLISVLVVGGPALAQAPAPAAAAGTASPATSRIGFIDLSRVLARSVAGVAAREQLEKEKAGMEREMEAKRQDLEKLREELEKKGPLMTADARREREELLDRKRRDATRLADDFQRELTRKEQQLAQRVLQEIAGVVDRVGKQKGYFMIMERRGAGIVFAIPEADLTDEIIRAYDQESATKGKK